LFLVKKNWSPMAASGHWRLKKTCLVEQVLKTAVFI